MAPVEGVGEATTIHSNSRLEIEHSPNGAVINTFLSSHTHKKITCLVCFLAVRKQKCQLCVSFYVPKVLANKFEKKA
jgi:hypothetical protein